MSGKDRHSKHHRKSGAKSQRLKQDDDAGYYGVEPQDVVDPFYHHPKAARFYEHPTQLEPSGSSEYYPGSSSFVASFDDPTQSGVTSPELTHDVSGPKSHKLWGKEKTRPKDTGPVDAPEPAPVADEAHQVATCTHYHSEPICPYCGPGGEEDDPSAHIWLPPQAAAYYQGTGTAYQAEVWPPDADSTSQGHDIASEMAQLNLGGQEPKGLSQPNGVVWYESHDEPQFGESPGYPQSTAQSPEYHHTVPKYDPLDSSAYMDGHLQATHQHDDSQYDDPSEYGQLRQYVDWGSYDPESAYGEPSASGSYQDPSHDASGKGKGKQHKKKKRKS